MKLKINSLNKVIDYETKFGEREILLTMQVNFISSLDFMETRTISTKSDNIEIMMGIETDEIIRELFESFFQRYQEGLEEPMKGSKFIFEDVDLYYHRQKHA